MENSLLVNISRQMALGRELDAVANNLANINTAGFKAEGAIFERFLLPGARSESFSGADRAINFVRDRSTWHDMSQGATQKTGNPLDVALDGQGFLVVQTPRGERYTRNGALQISAQGQLVTSEGFVVQGENGPIVLQPLDRDISISADGRVSVVEGANSKTESLRGKLRVVNFAQPQRLRKDGSSTFAAAAGADAQPAPQVRIVQGSVEKSNVRGIVEMARMVEINRAYTQVASILQQQNDLRRTAIERLAEVPA
ncbi:MAG: flagellar basal-body rod protein FlgF [Proteobacteria bacterium]|nr:flagellar basal-body rod protein FlgF [Pseudomonadota bacterium]